MSRDRDQYPRANVKIAAFVYGDDGEAVGEVRMERDLFDAEDVNMVIRKLCGLVATDVREMIADVPKKAKEE